MSSIPPTDFGQQVVTQSGLGWRVANRRRMAGLLDDGWVPVERFCSWCGGPTDVRWASEMGHDPDTGARNGHWETFCRRRSWWRVWHHSGGVLMPPPPKDRG